MREKKNTDDCNVWGKKIAVHFCTFYESKLHLLQIVSEAFAHSMENYFKLHKIILVIQMVLG